MLIFLTLPAGRLLCQEELPDSLSDNARITLLTIMPGAALYSSFGHSAIRITDPEHQLDRIYNYGTFDFDEPGFYLKFCRGKLDYSLSAYPYFFARRMYEREGRPIIEQMLRLTPQMRQQLYEFLEWNHLPENRRYRYDFFFDNCATRIRDVFENTLGDSLKLFYNDSRQMTFRNYIDIYLAPLPFSDFGIDIVLGARTDDLASGRQATFLPDYLYESLQQGTIRIDGRWQPFVVRSDTVMMPENAYRARAAVPWAAIICWAVFVTGMLLSWRKLKYGQPRPLLWFDRIFYGFTGTFGLIIFLLWFFTDHKVTPDNLNLFWLWPTHLVAAFWLPLQPGSTAKRAYFGLSALAAAILLAGWFFWPQMLHGAMIPLMLTLIVRGVDSAL